MKSQMAIGTKLLAGVGVLVLMLAALAAGALYSTGSLGTELTSSATAGNRTDMAGEMAALLQMMRTDERGMVMFSATNDLAQVSAEGNLFDQRATAFGQLIRDFKMVSTERGLQYMAILDEELPKYVQAEGQIRQLCEAGKTADSAAVRRDRAAPAVAAISKALSDVKDVQRNLFKQTSAKGAQQASFARWTIWSLMVLSLLAAGIVTRIVMSMSGQLRTAAAALDEGITQIDTAASQVASSSQSLAEGASQQAASLEETSASTEEITSMTRNNAQSSRAAAEVMTTVHNKVAEGNRALGEMTVSMQEINTSSDKIAKIIKVIDEIAFQTNILALNAAVEAARAGEAGAGFAVVADEVRSLAQRSAQASKDTALLIDESIASSRSGKDRLEKVSNVIHAITSSAEEVKTLVDSVSSGSEEQTRGIEQISKAVAHMDQTTQTTAATAEEGASAAEELSAQAQTMAVAVRQLRVLVDGSAAAAR
jgi:methyl-accepting chemotaxis protein/methyl-accepting chemotaxis protein-1 (serine sensor receptor)